jgi:hypothetical protein
MNEVEFSIGEDRSTKTFTLNNTEEYSGVYYSHQYLVTAENLTLHVGLHFESPDHNGHYCIGATVANTVIFQVVDSENKSGFTSIGNFVVTVNNNRLRISNAQSAFEVKAFD